MKVEHRQQPLRSHPAWHDISHVVTIAVAVGGALAAGWLAIAASQRGMPVEATLTGIIALLGITFSLMAAFRLPFATSWGFWFSGSAIIWGGIVIPAAPIAGALIVVAALMVATLLWNGPGVQHRRARLVGDREWGGNARYNR